MSEVGLKCERLENESWRECVVRYAKKYGLETEALDDFDSAIKREENPKDAAWSALYEWDLLEMYEEETNETS
jgi:hypothetical protein